MPFRQASSKDVENRRRSATRTATSVKPQPRSNRYGEHAKGIVRDPRQEWRERTRTRTSGRFPREDPAQWKGVPAGSKHSERLAQRGLWCRDMMKRVDVEDHVEPRVAPR